MQYLTIEEVVELHRRVVLQSGGSPGIRDRWGLDAEHLQRLKDRRLEELYPSLVDKAAALGYFLIQNHPFIDGNKRVGHAAMETVLILNGFEISASIDEQETTILAVAQGAMSRDAFTEWLVLHVVST